MDGQKLFDADVSRITKKELDNSHLLESGLITSMTANNKNYQSQSNKNTEGRLDHGVEGTVLKRDHSSLILKIDSEEAKQINQMFASHKNMSRSEIE